MWDLTDRLKPTTTPVFTPTGFELITESEASADGRYVAHTGFDATFNHFVRIWETAPGLVFNSPARRFDFGPLRSMAFRPGTSVIATGYENGNVSLWDLTQPAKPIAILTPTGPAIAPSTTAQPWRPPKAESLAFSPDGTVLAVGGSSGLVAVWDLSADHPQQRGSFADGQRADILDMTFEPNGRMLATTSGSEVYLHDITDPGAPRRLGPVLAGHSQEVLALAFSPDGRLLATGGYDSNTMLWDLTDPNNVIRLGQPFTDQAVTSVLTLAFTRDGQTLAASTTSGVLLLWDVTDRPRPRLLGQPIMPSGSAIDLFVVAPADHLLIAASEDGTIAQWNLTSIDQSRSNALARVCAMTAGGLDEREWAVYLPELSYQPSCVP